MAKSSAAIPIYYIDSCVFLALVNEEAGRYKLVEALLEAADREESEVFTSQLSIAEVAFGDQEKKGKSLSTTAEKRIDKLWHPSSPVRLVDVHFDLAVQAKSIIRQAMKAGWTKGENWSVKPPDAIHLATAKQVKAKKFFTYDDRLLKLKQNFIDVCEPFLVQGIIGVNL